MHWGFTAGGKTTAAVPGSVHGLPGPTQMLENVSRGRYVSTAERRRKVSSCHNMCS